MKYSDFLSKFGCRTDVYAEGQVTEKGGTAYYTVREPLTKEVLQAHFKGTRHIGVYPIVEGKVKWAAFDFDAIKDENHEVLPDSFERVLQDALVQQETFFDNGILSYVERSASGNGVHLWVFFDEWLESPLVYKVMRHLAIDSKLYDRIYPVQQDVAGLSKSLGNLLALPYYGAAITKGNTVFLDNVGKPLDLTAALNYTKENISEVFERIASTLTIKLDSSALTGEARAITEPSGGLVTGILKMISPYGNPFMRHCWENRKTLTEPEWYAALGQAKYFRYGREFAHLLSRDYPKYDKRETNRKFDQASENYVGGCTYIHETWPELACANCDMTAPYRMASKNIIELVKEADEPAEILGSFQEDLEYVKLADSGEVNSGEKWGIPGLDHITRFRPSELIAIGGMPSMGKTYLLVDNAYGLAKRGVHVHVFSAETSRRPLRLRMLARASGVDLTALRGERTGYPLTEEEWQQINAAADKLKTLPIYTDFTSLSANKVLETVERTILSKSIPLDASHIIFFDFIQFGFREVGESSNYEWITRSAGEFKFLSKILQWPVVIFSQLTRDKEGKDEAKITGWADSSAIEKHMDVGVVITGDRVNGSMAPRQLQFVKQREGIAGCSVDFLLHQNYGEWVPADAINPTRHDSLLGDFNVE